MLARSAHRQSASELAVTSSYERKRSEGRPAAIFHLAVGIGLPGADMPDLCMTQPIQPADGARVACIGAITYFEEVHSMPCLIATFVCTAVLRCSKHGRRCLDAAAIASRRQAKLICGLALFLCHV